MDRDHFNTERDILSVAVGLRFVINGDLTRRHHPRALPGCGLRAATRVASSGSVGPLQAGDKRASARSVESVWFHPD